MAYFFAFKSNSMSSVVYPYEVKKCIMLNKITDH